MLPLLSSFQVSLKVSIIYIICIHQVLILKEIYYFLMVRFDGIYIIIECKRNARGLIIIIKDLPVDAFPYYSNCDSLIFSYMQDRPL